jgi:murein DD-endopeptidase MepM/ murein hydrolase activator NlpD
MFSSGYGWRWGRMHKGIDVANNVGTPIVAAKSGRVTFSGWDDGGYGYKVLVQHEDGSQSLYAHNSRLAVRVGQTVEQGQLVSYMGSTGRSTGPHLHFEIHPPGRGAINPLQLLPPRA